MKILLRLINLIPINVFYAELAKLPVLFRKISFTPDFPFRITPRMYITKKALQNGTKPFFGDTGGALSRQNNTILDQRTIDAIIAGGN